MIADSVFPTVVRPIKFQIRFALNKVSNLLLPSYHCLGISKRNNKSSTFSTCFGNCLNAHLIQPKRIVFPCRGPRLLGTVECLQCLWQTMRNGSLSFIPSGGRLGIEIYIDDALISACHLPIKNCHKLAVLKKSAAKTH